MHFLSDQQRDDIIKRCEYEAMSHFQPLDLSTKELREKLSQEDKQRVLNFLFEKSSLYAQDLIHNMAL